MFLFKGAALFFTGLLFLSWQQFLSHSLGSVHKEIVGCPVQTCMYDTEFLPKSNYQFPASGTISNAPLTTVSTLI